MKALHPVLSTCMALLCLVSAQEPSPDEPARAVLDQLQKNRATEFQAIHEMKTEVLVVTAKSDAYDHVEKVLDGLKIKYDTTLWPDVPGKDLTPYAAVFVNCFGVPTKNSAVAMPAENISDELTSKFQKYVEGGGFLFTSDWALGLTSAAFPEFLSKPANKTGGRNELISVRSDETDHPLLRDVFAYGRNGRKAQWMIEARGRTFEVVPSARQKVKVLLTSDDLKHKYGSGLVAVAFDVGADKGKEKKQKAGTVLHVIGHFYQQGLGHRDRDEIARMYQMIVNFVLEARKSTPASSRK